MVVCNVKFCKTFNLRSPSGPAKGWLRGQDPPPTSLKPPSAPKSKSEL